MPIVSDEFLLKLLQACAARAPEPLYPVQFAKEQNLDRAQLDEGLDELRRRGLIQLTDWVRERGQGRALTDAGTKALASGRLAAVLEAPVPIADSVDIARNAYDRGEEVRRALVEPPPAFASRILLLGNIAYFLVGALWAWRLGLPLDEYLLGEGRAIDEPLIELGALHPSLVFFPDGRPRFERLLLYAFLHIGLIHLLMNLYFLGTLGPTIEAMWGTARFLVIYFVAAFVGGCMILLIDMVQRQAHLTAGASGALYGLFTAMMVWYSFNREHLPENFAESMSRYMLPNVIMMIAINFMSGVSWQGHFGGAVGGLLAALLLHVQRYHPSRGMRILSLLGVPLVPTAFFLALLWQAGWLPFSV